MLEVKRTQDDHENIMVSHLTREMRNCESMAKQIQTDLTATAVMANESSAVIASLSHKILCYTWKFTVNKLQGLHTDVLDERQASTIKKYCIVNSTEIREIIMNNTDVSRREAVTDAEVSLILITNDILKFHEKSCRFLLACTEFRKCWRTGVWSCTQYFAIIGTIAIFNIYRSIS